MAGGFRWCGWLPSILSRPSRRFNGVPANASKRRLPRCRHLRKVDSYHGQSVDDSPVPEFLTNTAMACIGQIPIDQMNICRRHGVPRRSHLWFGPGIVHRDCLLSLARRERAPSKGTTGLHHQRPMELVGTSLLLTSETDR